MYHSIIFAFSDISTDLWIALYQELVHFYRYASFGTAFSIVGFQ